MACSRGRFSPAELTPQHDREPAGLSREGGMSDARAVVEDDIRTARTLPVAFYRDAAVVERAREKVFARSWQHVDGAAAMRRTASALPFELLPGCLDEP